MANTVLSLLHRIRAFGPVTARSGYIGCSKTTPIELQSQLSDHYWEARALLEEWHCPESHSPVVATAESIIRNERSPEKAKRRQKPRRRTTSQMPLL
jgi:hypothetical protein